MAVVRLRETLDRAVAVVDLAVTAVFKRSSDDTNAAALAVVNFDSSGVEALPPESVSTGTATSGVALVTLNTTGYSVLNVQFTSVGSGNVINIDGSSDGTVGTGSTFRTDQAFTPIVAGVYQFPVTAPTMRVRVATYSSGTVTAYASLKRAQAPIQGKFNTTPPTLTDGQRGDLQLGSTGALNIQMMRPNTTTPIGVGSSGADGTTNAQTAYYNYVLPSAYNGTTWDRSRTIQGAIGAAGVGVTAVEANGALFSNITTATTTTVKSGAGILHNLTINTFVASATITVYNNTAGSGAKIATLTLPSTITSLGPLVLNYDLEFSTGLTLVTSGATDITVTYR